MASTVKSLYWPSPKSFQLYLHLCVSSFPGWLRLLEAIRWKRKWNSISNFLQWWFSKCSQGTPPPWDQNDLQDTLFAIFTVILSQDVQWSFPEVTVMWHVMWRCQCSDNIICKIWEPLSPIEPDINETCKNVNQCHFSHLYFFIQENVVIFHKVLFMLTSDGFLILFKMNSYCF